MTTKDGTVGRYLHWILVAFSLGAGVIHFAYAGEHFDVNWRHGTFFAVVAWFQLSWAIVLMVRSSRAVLALGAIVNALVIGTWIMSRVWGVPIGPGAWDPEPISLADGLATGLEVGIVAISLAVLARPALAQQSVRPSVGMAGIGPSRPGRGGGGRPGTRPAVRAGEGPQQPGRGSRVDAGHRPGIRLGARPRRRGRGVRALAL